MATTPPEHDPASEATQAVGGDLGGEAIRLTRELVAIDSVSPSLVPGAAGEAQIAHALAARLRRAGYDVQLLPAPGDDRRLSVLASHSGSQPGLSVVLNGHLDTVGVDGMAEPFTPRIAGGRLYGRGASDMKAGVAALVVVAEKLAATGHAGEVIVALVADEEDESLGAQTVLDHLARRQTLPDLCLVAEPTWLDVATAHRGYAVVEVTLRGAAAHSAQPENGVDALRAMGSVLSAIEAFDAELRTRAEHPLIGHGSMLATVARAGSGPFVVASQAEMTIERRTLPGESAADALREVRTLVEGAVGDASGLTVDARLTHARQAWQALSDGPARQFSDLLRHALEAAGAEPPADRGFPYWMESALWHEAGIPALVCGPAGGGLHAVDEWVDLQQVSRFAVALRHALQQSAAR